MANNNIYFAPIIINDRKDLENYNITWADTRTIHFGMSGSVTIYPYPTEDKALYDFFKRELNNEHSDAYRATRCQVVGRRGRLVRCDTKNRCSCCPYGNDPHAKESNIVSLDGMIDVGQEPGSYDATSEHALAKAEYAELRARMDAEDMRIAQIFEDYERIGLSIAELQQKYSLSRRRVFQLLARAKEIGRQE